MDNNYRGIYAGVENDKQKFFEGGAHFRYQDLFQKLKALQEDQEEVICKKIPVQIPSQSRNKAILNPRNTQKQTQSRNYKALKPLIQSITQTIEELAKKRTNSTFVRKEILPKDHSQERPYANLNYSNLNSTRSYINNNSSINSSRNKQIISSYTHKTQASGDGNIIQNIFMRPNINISINNNTFQSKFGSSSNNNINKSRNVQIGINAHNSDANYSMRNNPLLTKKYTSLDYKYTTTKLKPKAYEKFTTRDAMIDSGKIPQSKVKISNQMYTPGLANGIYEKKRVQYNYQQDHSRRNIRKSIDTNYATGFSNKSFVTSSTFRTGIGNH